MSRGIDQIIEKIEIKRFRSFGNATIEAKQLNIYSGKNNSGKSNILRALNLFFNQKSNYDSPYDHSTDYNKAFKGASGGKRAIEITIHFLPTGTGALSSKFYVKRTYTADSDTYEQTLWSANAKVQEAIEGKNGRVTRQFTRFLNRITYIYVPAVRDKKFVRALLLNFEQIIKSDAGGKDFDKAIGELSLILGEKSIGISKDFEKYINLPAKATLSSNTQDILGAVEINVESGIQVKKKRPKKNDKNPIEDVTVSLFSSGDGVLMSYLVYFLAYLTKKSKDQFIWGFEEPENSLEFSKVQALATEFNNKFVKDAQIFITTHSPAFINLKDEPNVAFYRVYIPPQQKEEIEEERPDKRESRAQRLDDIRGQLTLFGDQPELINVLNEELHLVEQAIEIQDAVKRINEEKKELAEQNKRLEEQYRGLLKAFPDNIFICEDENGTNLWKSLLEKAGIDVSKITVISSCGCTTNNIETWVIEQKRYKSSYNPSIFREVDRDGYLDNQVAKIKERQQISNHERYRYSVLPVNEIENFALLNEPLCTEDLWEQHKDLIKDEFQRTAHHNLNTYNKKFWNKDVEFPVLTSKEGISTIQEMRDTAASDWKRYMPGKSISSKIPNFNPMQKLNGISYNALPDELKDYLSEIKEFFQDESIDLP